MQRREINLMLAGGGLGWLSALLCLMLFPVEGARWSIVGTVLVTYPMVFGALAIGVEWLYARSKRRASPAPTDA